MNFERLRSHADDPDLFVELVPRVGDHVLPEELMFRVWPEHRAEELAELGKSRQEAAVGNQTLSLA